MSKHTSGPWSIDSEEVEIDYGDFYVANIRPQGPYRGDICRLQDSHHIDGISAEECAANARLIAAAPELLEALRQITKQYILIRQLRNGDTPEGCEEIVCVMAARKAIAKAQVTQS